MSYDQLEKHAQDIAKTAAEAEYQMALRAANPPGYQNQHYNGPQPDKKDIMVKYDNIVLTLFEPYVALPDPSSYDGPIKNVLDAMTDLSHGDDTKDPIDHHPIGANPRLHWIDDAGDALQDWNGAAADAFKNKFLGRFDAVSINQFLVLGVMKGGIEAHQSVWRHARKDIDDIAHKTLDALDNMGGCGQNDVSFLLTVAGAVAAIAAIPFTGGASAIAIPAVGAAVATAGAVDAAVEYKGGGSTPEQIVKSMKTAIDKLTKQIRDQEEKIAKAMLGYAGEVQAHKGQDTWGFVSPRPKLAGMKGPKLTSDQGLGTYG